MIRSSWLNCALRDDEAVYWVSIGHYKAVAVGDWWYWVSRGNACLYRLHKVEIWTGVTDALQTHWLTDWQTLKERATQLLIKYKSGALVTQLRSKIWCEFWLNHPQKYFYFYHPCIVFVSSTPLPPVCVILVIELIPETALKGDLREKLGIGNCWKRSCQGSGFFLSTL